MAGVPGTPRRGITMGDALEQLSGLREMFGPSVLSRMKADSDAFRAKVQAEGLRAAMLDPALRASNMGIAQEFAFLGSIKPLPTKGAFTVYRGGDKGNYFSEGEEYAAEFGKVQSKQILPEWVLDLTKPEHQNMVRERFGEETLGRLTKGQELPPATDAESLDLLDKITPELGFRYSRQFEGEGQPPSVFFHGRPKRGIAMGR